MDNFNLKQYLAENKLLAEGEEDLLVSDLKNRLKDWIFSDEEIEALTGEPDQSFQGRGALYFKSSFDVSYSGGVLRVVYPSPLDSPQVREDVLMEIMETCGEYDFDYKKIKEEKGAGNVVIKYRIEPSKDFQEYGDYD